jgi:hypothetical protein
MRRSATAPHAPRAAHGRTPSGTLGRPCGVTHNHTEGERTMDLFRRGILLFEAFITFHLMIAALRFFPYARVAGRALRPLRTAKPRSEREEEALAHQVGRALEVVRRFDYRTREDCLPRALTIYRLLARRGVEGTFRIGVRRGPFTAHSWVELRGSPVGDTRSKVDLYTPLVRATGSHGAAGAA